MLICENLSFSIDGHKLFSNIDFKIKNEKDLLITGLLVSEKQHY